jgi:hypothetical protein
MNPRVKKIIAIDGLVITVLWSDGIMRTVDFRNFLAEYFQKPDSIYYQLIKPETLREAKANGKTIFWDNLVKVIDYDGNFISAPLDFDPDVLFERSEPIDTIYYSGLSI